MKSPRQQSRLHPKRILKIQDHKHTGKLRPHNETSFILLALLLAACGLLVRPTVPLFGTTVNVPGTVTVSVTVPGPPPTDSPVLYVPSGFKTDAPFYVVSGSCRIDMAIEIFDNGVFAGTTSCMSDLSFQIRISLQPGSNNLIGYFYDTLDQAGPGSTPAVILYSPPSTPSPSTPQSNVRSTAITEEASVHDITSVIITSVEHLPKTTINQTLAWPLTIQSATWPAILTIDWGDGVVDKFTIDQPNIEPAHSYRHPGKFTVIAKIIDAMGNVGQLQTVVGVSGEVSGKSPTKCGTTGLNLFERTTAIIANADITQSNCDGESSSVYDITVRALYRVAAGTVAIFWTIEGFVKGAVAHLVAIVSKLFS